MINWIIALGGLIISLVEKAPTFLKDKKIDIYEIRMIIISFVSVVVLMLVLVNADTVFLLSEVFEKFFGYRIPADSINLILRLTSLAVGLLNYFIVRKFRARIKNKVND